MATGLMLLGIIIFGFVISSSQCVPSCSILSIYLQVNILLSASENGISHLCGRLPYKLEKAFQSCLLDLAMSNEGDRHGFDQRIIGHYVQPSSLPAACH